MSSAWELTFDPLLPLALIAVLATLGLAQILTNFIRLRRFSTLRALVYAALCLTLANPILHKDERELSPDIVVLAVDNSRSQAFADRTERTQKLATDLEKDLRGRENLELRTLDLSDLTPSADSSAREGGTRLLSAVNAALQDIPENRLGGVIAITDGQIADTNTALQSAEAAPFHTILTGSRQDMDRRLALVEVPKFAIVGQETKLKLKIEDFGKELDIDARFDFARIEVKLNGEVIGSTLLEVQQEHELVFKLERRGESIIEITAAPLKGELTELNNRVAFSVNGIRDRLRVLLVSGEPHAGERTWRNLLKADPSVDLVHFTILRPPEKQDGTPASELSLIAFPTRELFAQKLNEFDLVIFDRFRRRGVLPIAYLANVARYVENGGAMLTAAGPSYASPFSLYLTPLSEVMPAAPTGQTIEKAFRPKVAELGQRHPVTAELPGANVMSPTGKTSATWGQWFRLIEAKQFRGHTLMEGPDGAPLLIVDQYGRGRVAQILSDQAWLWTRGYDGGGPQAELLRRTAHWLMKEPELEEEQLTASALGPNVTITRRSLASSANPVTVQYPSGKSEKLLLTPFADGIWQTDFASDELGLHLIADDDLSTLVSIGPLNPKEFEEVVGTDEKLATLAKSTDGGLIWLEDTGTPRLYDAQPGRNMHGPGRLGIKRNNQFTVTEVSERALLPPWLALAFLAGLLIATWRRDSL